MSQGLGCLYCRGPLTNGQQHDNCLSYIEEHRHIKGLHETILELREARTRAERLVIGGSAYSSASGSQCSTDRDQPRTPIMR